MKRFLVIAACLLAGCQSTPSLRTVMERLNQRYTGQEVQEFFLHYGRPAGKAEVAESGKLYRWASIQPTEKFTFPVPHVSNGQLFPSSGARAPGGLACQLAIETDKKSRIRAIRITHDSEGERSNSRCAEIFSMD